MFKKNLPMTQILASVLLFGFVHPLSKVLLETGIPLTYFCLGYIGFRVLFLAPLFLCGKTEWRFSKKELLPLIFLGFVGAGLQFFEFKGIEDGVPPNVVTFLVFSYPLWIILFKILRGEIEVISSDSLRGLLVIVGVIFVSGVSLVDLSKNLVLYLAPILASFCMASWVELSTHIKRRGVPSLTLSLFYDLFSLATLLILFSGQLGTDWVVTVEWWSLKNLLLLGSYSFFIGLLPNLLFYQGSLKVNSTKISFLMALEPVFSTIYTAILWVFPITTKFLIGGLAIVVGNLSIGKMKFLSKRSSRQKRERAVACLEN